MQKFWGTLFAILLLAACSEKKQESSIKTEESKLPEPLVETREYGFNLGDFNVTKDTIQYGDSFGEIMQDNEVDYNKVVKIINDYKEVFDARKIRVGKPYLLLRSKDSLDNVEVFVYQNDLINYTVIDFRDSVLAYNAKKEIKYVEREASGVIATSLSEAILNQGIDYNITNDLSEIYAWTIDFFRLQKGDKFKVIIMSDISTIPYMRGPNLLRLLTLNTVVLPFTLSHMSLILSRILLITTITKLVI